MARPLPVAVLVSGVGSTLDVLAERAPSVGAAVVLVVADRAGIPALAVAARHGVPSTVIPMPSGEPASVTAALDGPLRARAVELVVLAGLRSILPSEWVARWAGRVLNVHPSLLPRHGGKGQYGRRVYESILAGRDRESGATVHLVTSDVDAGPVLLQERFPVAPSETVESLQARTQAVERRLLLEAVARFADGRWRLPYEPSVAPSAPADRRAGRV
jgi:phosphoribosylglycinamide formyltransferase-1